MSCALLLLLAANPVPSSPEVEAARARYTETRQFLELERRHFAEAYRSLPKQRPAILQDARQLLERRLIDDLVPAWTTTNWEFSGRSDTPGVGSIACGTYVGTLFAHAGFRLNRIAVGRLASEHIALTLTSKKNLRRWSNKKASRVAKEIEEWGPGLYAVGLDYHAGLIWVDADNKAWFIHSTVLGKGQAVVEPLLEPGNPFLDSRYRIAARLLDDSMMKAWLRGKQFKTFGT